MTSDSVQIDKIKNYLLEVLKPLVDSKSIEWLEIQKQKVEEESSYLKFYMAFGQASRYFKKNTLTLSDNQKKEAENLVTGFRPATWDLLQAARIFLLLHYKEKNAGEYVSSLTRLFETADMHEQQSLYAALPLLPHQENLVDRAIEGLRTNIVSVFDAVALNNPFPANHFDERAWNQMVLKAIFLQRPLFKIQKSDSRANFQLAEILLDFAHERWAAGRVVVPELWRFVGPFLNASRRQDIEKVLGSEEYLQVKAGLLALSQSKDSFALDILKQYPETVADIASGSLTWDVLGQAYLETLDI
jgi:hypothetical protein